MILADFLMIFVALLSVALSVSSSVALFMGHGEASVRLFGLALVTLGLAVLLWVEGGMAT